MAPSISCRGAGLSRGQLLVNVVGCTRLTDLAADSRLYCTLSVGRLYAARRPLVWPLVSVVEGRVSVEDSYWLMLLGVPD